MNDDEIWTDGPRRPPRREQSSAQVTPPARTPLPVAETEGAHRSGAGRWLRAIALVAVGALLGGTGAAVASNLRSDGDGSVSTAPSTTVPVESTDISSTTVIAEQESTTTEDLVTTSTAPPTTIETVPLGNRDDLAIAEALGPLTMPSDCGLPFGVPESLPNGARDYRGGVHEGIDFICAVRGRSAFAALDGRVVMANAAFVDPDNGDRQVILDTAKALGRTPPWTLAMLFGRVVVLDHGNHPGVGHVVTVYAHLEEIDPAMKPGVAVAAGQRIGEIGNTGTETGATGGTRPQSIHLHWEIHIDDEYLAKGADDSRTDQIYRALFGR